MSLLRRSWRPLLAAAALAGMRAANAAEYAWMEGEAGQAGIAVKTGGWGNAKLLSGDSWLHVSIDEGKVAAELPAEGAVIRYPFRAVQAGAREIWARIGFEFVRSPFEWRVDDGAWTNVSPDELTTDLMEIATWCEVAWLKLGDRPLAAGDHVLEIRLPRTLKPDGKPNRVLFALDALCVHAGAFRPNGRFKPDESGRTDADLAAERHVFQLPEAAPGNRASVSLAGTWEVARDDEQLPGEVARPIASLPQAPVFRAIPVPSDKNVSRKDLIFGHRLWYRTRVSVPASMAGRSFHLDFPLNNLNTTVFVNGMYCGFEKNPFCRFQIDITRGIRAGQVNEIWVGIRDAWYGRSADPERPLKLRRTFNIPIGHFHNGFQDLDYPVWNCSQSGILATPTLVAAGGAYTADVFVKPSVAHRSLGASVVITNTGSAAVSGELRLEAVDATNAVAVTGLLTQPFSVQAGRAVELELSAPWPAATLWWPDAPHLYTLRTVLTAADGKTIDTRETTFGFREWRIGGTQFLLNGIPWRMWADLVGTGATPDQWLAAYRRTNMRTHRLSTAGQAATTSRWLGLEPEMALDFFDRNGVVVRRNTTLDGEMIGYNFAEKDAETVRKQGGSTLKLALMRNWRDQCVAQVRGERNHPSIQIWTIENEFAFINLINLLGNSPNMDAYEQEIRRCHDAVMAADPTRSVMIDGGGSLKDHSLGVHGDHYVATLDTRYPDLAYEPFIDGGGRGRWTWDQQRPRFIGEDFFATGIEPADFAAWGGEVAFQGKAAVRDAIATCYRMLTEGYRWGGHYAAWHFWLGGEGGPRQWIANAPTAVLCRQWDWTFGAGETAGRTYRLLNDTRHAARLSFTRQLVVPGQKTQETRTSHDVSPGACVTIDERLVLPAVKQRTEAELVLRLEANGRELFRDTKAVSILPPIATVQAPAGTLALFDPAGRMAGVLESLKIPFAPVRSINPLPAGIKVLIVGPDALTEADSTSPALAAAAAAGRAVVVLDQSHPLHFQALPAEVSLVATNKTPFAAEGRTAFIEDSSHPALAGLMDKDFFTWGPNRLVYRQAYRKPTAGARSLVQAGPRLAHSALMEVPVGKGVLYICQLSLGSRLQDHAVSRRLLVNMIAAGLGHRQEFHGVKAALADPSLQQALDAIGLQYDRAPDSLAAIGDGSHRIAIISATPPALAALAGAPARVEAFWKRGGTIVFHGLTPEGLADYNRILGIEHLIRPFGRERVQFPPVRNALTVGLSSGDLVMLSGKRIFGFRADEYVVSDVFSHVVDVDDIAPFAASDFHAYGNIVNGFIGADGWPLIIDFPIPTNEQPFSIRMTLPREETIRELTYDQSLNYNPTTRIALLFDGRDRTEFDLAPNGDGQTFAVDPPRRAKEVVLQTCDWQIDPAKARNQGIDNIRLAVTRSEAFRSTVKPMLNVGGLMQYVKGNGGAVLCNVQFPQNEAVPANRAKRRAILAVVLRNLKAPFAGGRTVIPGSDLAFTPIDIHTKATTYKDERGWFGNNARTFKGLPAGRHTLAGVEFDVYEMPTSPVPQVLMTAGRGVPGNLPPRITDIAVDAKADALFFLHAARLDVRRTPKQLADNERLPLCTYVVTYADGQKAEVPVLAEIDVEHYVQKKPAPLPGAQIGWTQPYDKSDDHAVAYVKQWNNPRPDVAIRSLDLVPAEPSRGVPVLIAVTAATASP